MIVYPRHGESLQGAMKRLKKLCEREGIVKEMKKHEAYEKKCEKNRRKKFRRRLRARAAQLPTPPITA